MASEIKLDWVFRTAKNPESELRAGFWGDYSPWTSYLPLAWATIDMRDFTVQPRVAQVRTNTLHSHAISTWAAVVHLLGLGLGWTDLTAGLKAWKGEGFGEGLHPVLDSVKRLVGDEIESLELYFGIAPRGIIQALREIQAAVSGGPAVEPYVNFSSGDYEEMTRLWLGRVQRHETSLGAFLLDGGDALHLDGHIHAMLLERGIDLAATQLRQDFGSHTVITMNKYHGWGHRLAAQTRDLLATPLGDFANKSVEVKIQQLGSLGTFAFDVETSRWFRYSSDYRTSGFQLQNEIHRWGRQK
jgi:hypothetical protein